MSEPEPVLVVDLFPVERQHLLQLLAQLREEEWHRPTVCAGWTVKDIALHLLGDDIGRLSRDRDYFTSLDLFALGEPVSWAGSAPAPVWLDVAREYTERWVHQQQIRDAVGRPGLKEQRFFAPILATFVRALPHTFREVDAPDGTLIHLNISGEAGSEWYLHREQGTWKLEKTGGLHADASVTLDQERAWRLFTKGISKDEAIQHATISGNELLARKVFDTVSIIA
jgi:hypothetical protein